MSPGSVGEKTLFTVEAIKKSIYHKLFYKTHLILNKFALLWGEAQLCLPYVC